jgi:uncharacterized membrane protein
MAQIDFTPAPAFRTAAPKARMNVYFAMLIIALVAMLVACLFMYLEIRRFGGFGAIQGRVAAVERAAPDSLARLSHAGHCVAAVS